ncbi:MAG: hypothetical protein SGI91_08725 [Alphaproteobacteria bacterium]|nr:hypothetical protein [Alphaproteobacteria bacterium]
MRALAIACAVLILTQDAQAAPSFNCNKATATAEKEICRVPNLQWFDRQLARLYKLAREQAGANTPAIIASQRDFIESRNACNADNVCIESAYKTRLTELSPQVNVYEPFAEYRAAHGTLTIVRFGLEAGLNILTVGDNGHTCVFETDHATVGGKGVVRWNDKSCRITIVPNDSEASLVVETKNCQDYCGMRAVMDGTYSRAN